MKTILVTGSTGFLGNYLVKKLKKKHKVISLGFKQSADYKIDLLNKKEFEKIISKTKPEIILNLAAITDVDFCEKNKELCQKLNYKLVKNLVFFSKIYNFNIIQISTDHVYNKSKYNLEKDIKIKNYYAKTKFMSDKIIKKSGGCALRTNFFGIDNKNKRGLINWLKKNDKNKKKIYLFKNVFFSPLHVKTLSKYIQLVCEKFKPGIYNVGSKNKISKSEFGKKIIKILKLKINFDEINYEHKKFKLTAKRPLNMQMDVSNFEKTFLVKVPLIEKEILKLK